MPQDCWRDTRSWKRPKSMHVRRGPDKSPSSWRSGFTLMGFSTDSSFWRIWGMLIPSSAEKKEAKKQQTKRKKMEIEDVWGRVGVRKTGDGWHRCYFRVLGGSIISGSTITYILNLNAKTEEYKKCTPKQQSFAGQVWMLLCMHTDY